MCEAITSTNNCGRQSLGKCCCVSVRQVTQKIALQWQYLERGLLSAMCLEEFRQPVLFLCREDTIECTVTGAQYYSADLPQGGLEVPCELRFQGSSQDIAISQKLLVPARSSGTITNASVKHTPVEQPRRKLRCDPDVVMVEDMVLNSENQLAPQLSLNQIDLSIADKEITREGKQSTDKHDAYAQAILKS